MAILLKSAIVCEGKYDKMRLSQLFCSPILSLDGFQIQNNPQQQALLKQYAALAPLVVITDADKAGFLLRQYVTRLVGEANVLPVFIPAVPGKERRKATPSKEGLLGVEGLSDAMILSAFQKAGVLSQNNTPQPTALQNQAPPAAPLEASRLFLDGFLGTENSAVRRRAFLAFLQLPPRMNSKDFIKWCNRNGGPDYYEEQLKRFQQAQEKADCKDEANK